MRLVDIVLPISLTVFLFGETWPALAKDNMKLTCATEVVSCFGVTALAVSAVSWFAIAIPFVAVVLVVVQRFYVRTSKQLRLLE